MCGRLAGRRTSSGEGWIVRAVDRPHAYRFGGIMFSGTLFARLTSSQVAHGALRRMAVAFAFVGAFACLGSIAEADTQLPVQKWPSASSSLKAQDQVDGANGSFTQTIPIEVPPF